MTSSGRRIPRDVDPHKRRRLQVPPSFFDVIRHSQTNDATPPIPAPIQNRPFSADIVSFSEKRCASRR